MEKKLKQNAERYGVREGSWAEVQWAVQSVGEDLWWEGLSCMHQHKNQHKNLLLMSKI